jgi:hypothetical protein
MKQPTGRQVTVLRILWRRNGMTAKAIGVRSDVLWRMEERGWVTRDLHGRWRIKSAGIEVLGREVTP